MLHAENQTEKKEEKSFCNFLLEMLYSVAPPCGWYWLLHIELNQTSVNIHSPLSGFAVIFQVKYTRKIYSLICFLLFEQRQHHHKYNKLRH